MSRYSCLLAGEIGREYRLSPEQVSPKMLRTLGRTWRPKGRDLSQELNAAADRLGRELDRLGLPQEARPDNEDGRAMARKAMSGNPATAALLSEVERGWERRGKS